MANIDFIKLRQKLDGDLASHDVKGASLQLKELRPDDIPPVHRADFAALARRCNLPDLALKILWPNIFETKGPNVKDSLEYAGSLRKLGLVNQAHLLLERLPASPSRDLNLAFNHIHQWQYKEALVLLEQCQGYKDQDQRFFQLTHVNLVASLIIDKQTEKALALLTAIKADLKLTQPHLFLNALELEGYCYLDLNQPELAEKTFLAGLQLVKTKTDLTSLFLSKGLALSSLALAKEDAEDKLSLVREQIRQQRHWESLREFDLQEAKIKNSRPLLEKVYFGSPFADFKSLIHDSLLPSVPDTYLWQNKPLSKTLDLTLVNLSTLAFGKTEHRLLMVMGSDLYRPFPVTRIFDQLFKNEVYDPFSSDGRIHQLLKGLRDTLKQDGLETLISSTLAGYRIRPTEEFGIALRAEMVFDSVDQLVFSILKHQTQFRFFKREDIESLLPLSKDQWQRSLKRLVERQLLDANGNGRAKSYRLKAA